jgi:hypothetical protein
MKGIGYRNSASSENSDSNSNISNKYLKLSCSSDDDSGNLSTNALRVGAESNRESQSQHAESQNCNSSTNDDSASLQCKNCYKICSYKYEINCHSYA